MLPDEHLPCTMAWQDEPQDSHRCAFQCMQQLAKHIIGGCFVFFLSVLVVLFFFFCFFFFFLTLAWQDEPQDSHRCAFQCMQRLAKQMTGCSTDHHQPVLEALYSLR